MSDPTPRVRTATRLARVARRRRDRGSTLPELIITVMLLGLVMGSLTAAVIVMVRQQDNSEGRLNVARSETNIAMWLPADLASAEAVDVTAGASPCGGACPANAVTGGSNAIMLSWDSLEAGTTAALTTRINVSYRYVKVGATYQLVRVECQRVETGPWSCANTVVLRDLSAPPLGTAFTPGVTSPSWVINVSDPVDPGSVASGPGVTTTTTPVDPSAPVRRGSRVVVTVNGGGDADGAGGGLNTISLSAGGTTNQVIDATSTVGTPTFTEARSRCGGTFGLIIDKSGSIGSAMSSVRTGVQTFIDKFAGTPVKIQVVRFDSTASVYGPGRGRYYDMLVPADVTEIRNAVGGLTAGGGTNWEDGFHRMFYTETGAVQATLPDKVLFFTDGQPTTSRLSATTSPSAPKNPPSTTSTVGRTKYIADQFRASVDFIGVGVGTGVNTMNLAQVVAGDNVGVPAQLVNGAYVNAATANMYTTTDWAKFATALEAVALAECGGTLTLQTRLSGGPAPDPFEYQHTGTSTSAGVPVTPSLEVVRTSATFQSGTFDFSIPTGGWLTIDIQPLVPAGNLYQPVGWTCTAGISPKTVQTFPVNGGPWTGIRLRVSANEAISCVMEVTR